MYILYIIVLKIKLITNLHALSVAIHVLSNNKKSVILICRNKYMNTVYPVFNLNRKIIDEFDTVRYT